MNDSQTRLQTKINALCNWLDNNVICGAGCGRGKGGGGGCQRMDIDTVTVSAVTYLSAYLCFVLIRFLHCPELS